MSLGRVAFKGLADAESSPVAQLGGGCNPSGSPSPWAPARFGPRHDEHRARVAPRAGWPPAAASTSPPASLTSRASSTLTRTRPRSWAVARSQTAHIARLERQRTAPHSCLADRYEEGGHHASPGGARPTRRPGSQSPQNAGLVKPGRSRSAAQIPAGHRPAVHSASPLDVAGSPDSCQPRATRC